MTEKLNDQSGQVARILSTADESFRKMKDEIDAMKIVPQRELNAIRTSLQKVEKEISDMKKDA